MADKITVESRRAGVDADQAVRWVSAGTGEFEVEQIHKDSRGTDIILHLREDALDYLQSHKVKQLSINTQITLVCRLRCKRGLAARRSGRR